MWIAPTSPAAGVLRALGHTRRRGGLPVVICFDVEPDPRTLSAAEAGPWRGFERLAERLPALRARLASLTGHPAEFTWFLRMDPQIERLWGSTEWAPRAYADTLAGLEAAGDELGLHTHTWRWDPDRSGWFADFSDEPWAEHCVTCGLDAFESAFGRRCAAHRGGDAFLSAAMVATLAERRVTVDLTVEPGHAPEPLPAGERHRGRLPDHRGAPSHPFRTNPARFPSEERSSSSLPLFIPHLTSPAPIRRRPVHASSRNFAPRLALALLARWPRVLAIAVRTDVALDSWETIAANLEHLARHPGVHFVTASSAAATVSTPDQAP